MRRDPAQRIADALAAIERCQRYVAALDGDADVVETYLPPLADALRSNINVDWSHVLLCELQAVRADLVPLREVIRLRNVVEFRLMCDSDST